ncbi:hypothetical protein HPB49_010769 [Dermacentor silvarum]|uniref:Uncharacterized protein n=1 Tax=Dermacentor silvarum TaxID=543639 RepID=A0ACB8C8Z6_DERSI|nr:hypothetical protein HPB49_010769 [Dermacentor silvarum]
MTVFAASERTVTDVSLLEERAIARAIISTSSLHPSTPNYILTDSQAALPGHAAIPGNECAHALARELSHRAAGDRSAIIRPHPFSYASQLAEIHLTRQHYPHLILPLLADRLSVGDNYRGILSRRPFSIPTSTPPVVQLNARTAVTTPPY